jgi:hypothetical protein
MSSGIAGQALETCQIVWWAGYVKGRFQAYTTQTSLAPELVDESPAIRWRSDLPPGPVEPAVAALEVLTRRLADAGWVVTGRSDETWYGLMLSRPAAEGARPETLDDRPEPEVHREPAPPPEAHLDSALLTQLRSELEDARHAAELERTRRIEAESGALRLIPPQDDVPEPPRSRVLFFTLYAAAVAAAVLVFLVGFDSVYAAVDAGLTTAAVCVALDSWLVVHRRSRRAERKLEHEHAARSSD